MHLTYSFLEIFENHFSAAFPEFFLVFAISILLLYGVIFSSSLHQGLPLMARPITWLSFQVLFITFLLVVNLPTKELTFFHGLLHHDAFVGKMKAVLLVGGMAFLFLSLGFFKRERINAFEYQILVLLSLLGIFLILSANDLISMYLAIELQSLSFYVLAAFKKDSAFSTEAGLKYFVLGAFSSGLLLFGSSLIYGATGTTSFEGLATLSVGLYSSSTNLPQSLLVGFLFLGSGLLFKMGAAPFHMWTPDVYEGSPTLSSTLFALLPKAGILGLSMKVFIFALYDFMEVWEWLFLGASFASMIIGAFGAFQQRKVKRLLAFSSIGHVGYMLMGMVGGSVEGLQALVLYLMLYMVMTLSIWTFLLSLDFQGRGGRVQYLTDITSLFKMNPFLAVSGGLTLFSMAGVPPLAGFCAKLYIFFGAVGNGLYLLAAIGLLSSCLSAFYYLRFIKLLFVEKKGAFYWTQFDSLDREKSILLGLTLVFIVCFFAYPSPLLLLAQEMAMGLAL